MAAGQPNQNGALSATYFLDENQGTYNQSGEVANQDDSTNVEQGVLVPWLIDPASSWLDYRCDLEVRLDPGMVCHYPLPQQPTSRIDTLATADVADVRHETYKTGVNTIAQAAVQNLPQRMATSRYFFVLSGRAMRCGYQVPIPGLKTVAGVPAVPMAPQRAMNTLVGNIGGIPVWLAVWELWYFVYLPPKSQQLPPANLADHIRADVQLPTGLQVPYSQPDQSSVTQPIPQQAPLAGFVIQGKR